MANALIALQILSALLGQASEISALIQQSQASGVDITPAQLAALTSAYQAAVDKLNADIATAQAAGK